MKKLVVVVDAQNDFIDQKGALSVAGADKVKGKIEEYLKSLSREETFGVLLTFDTHDAEVYPTSDEGQQFPIHCVKGTWGWELAVDTSVVDESIPVYSLEKDVFDMWGKDEFIIKYHNAGNIGHVSDQMGLWGKLEIVIVGVASDYCVNQAIRGFVDRGFKVTVLRDLVKGIARDIDQVIFEDYPDNTQITVV